MTILKHEVRSGLAGCILWSAVTGGLMALCVSMYPSMSGQPWACWPARRAATRRSSC